MDNLKAVFSQRNSTKPLSHEEFQEMLNSWFRDKGVLTELKLHLRLKLVSLLKDTVIGRGISQNNSQSISLFNQALNLIVAEYLMRNKCYYSLSIFNTEATFTSVLPDYPICYSEESKQNEFCDLYFNRANILKILDLIGLTKTSTLYDKLVNIYFNTQENESIISCLITLLSEPPKVNTGVNDEQLSKDLHEMIMDNSSEVNFMQKIEEILTHANLSSSYVKKFSHNINLFYEIKREQQKKELLDVMDQLKSELTSKDKTIKKLHKSKHIIEGQLIKVNKSYGKAKLRLENLLHKESLLKESILWQSKQIDYAQIKKDELKDDNFKSNSLPFPKEEDMIRCQIPHCNEICKENIKLNKELLYENLILKKENEEQKDMLQKFFLIYKDLLSKFDNCQNKLNFLNSTLNKELTDELFSNYLYGNNLNIEAPEQKNDDDSEISLDSITEEALHQARTKLQTLEDETNEIEDKFKSFHYS